jgi:hypothetical protein
VQQLEALTGLMAPEFENGRHVFNLAMPSEAFQTSRRQLRGRMDRRMEIALTAVPEPCALAANGERVLR